MNGSRLGFDGFLGPMYCTLHVVPEVFASCLEPLFRRHSSRRSTLISQGLLDASIGTQSLF